MEEIPGFTGSEFTALGKTRPVYRRGPRGEAPPIVLCHELPGLTPETVKLAERLVGDGFRVYLPLLYGKALQPYSDLKSGLNVPRLCLSREFHLFARERTSPVADWLRELCGWVSEENGGARVGVVGMCLTGGFVLVTTIHPAVGAGVLAQPALPLKLLPGSARALGISPDDLEAAKERPVPLLGLRFSSDKVSPCERFQALEDSFGERFEHFSIPSPDAEHGIGEDAHSVLVYEYRDDEDHPTRRAYRRVVEFLHEALSRGSEPVSS